MSESTARDRDDDILFAASNQGRLLFLSDYFEETFFGRTIGLKAGHCDRLVDDSRLGVVFPILYVKEPDPLDDLNKTVQYEPFSGALVVLNNVRRRVVIYYYDDEAPTP